MQCILHGVHCIVAGVKYRERERMDALLPWIVWHTLPIFRWLFFFESESDDIRERTGCHFSHRTQLEPVSVQPPGHTLGCYLPEAEKLIGDWMRQPSMGLL